MTTMLERAARALAEYEYGDGHDEPWEPFVGQVIDMLQAIREPSEDMGTAGYEALAAAYENGGPASGANACFQAMIDTILSDRMKGG
jgi:hypothetical protein